MLRAAFCSAVKPGHASFFANKLKLLQCVSECCWRRLSLQSVALVVRVAIVFYSYSVAISAFHEPSLFKTRGIIRRNLREVYLKK